MMHKRIYSVMQVDDAADLARKLTQQSWCLCNGFQFRDYYLLNDATSEDGAQEFGVINRHTLQQVESITASWMSAAEMKKFLTKLEPDAEPFDDGWNGGPVKVESADDHESCRHCA